MPPLTHLSEQAGVSVQAKRATSVSLADSLELPDVRKFSLTNHSCFYGALAVAASYCGLDQTPEKIRGRWQHGWVASHWQFDPLTLVLGTDIWRRKSGHYWVARQDEASYLRGHGFKNARAIGLPIVYLLRPQVERRPGSLLVMPAHSLDYTTHNWRFDEYADEIARIRGDFTEVVVCIHPSCWKRGYWVDAFKQRGFEVVEGTLIDDLNALQRVQKLLSTFEYVTTNYLGSHVVYAAYLGAKVSVFGPYAGFKAEDFANDRLYIEHPHLLEPTIRAASEAEMRRHYPDLFCHPLEARERVEWGQREVGHDNKLSPAKLRAMFRWRASDRAASKIWKSLPWRVRHLSSLLFEPAYRRRYIETRWLSKTGS